MRHFEASTDAARDRHMREMMSLSLPFSRFNSAISHFHSPSSAMVCLTRARVTAADSGPRLIFSPMARRARRPSWRLCARWRRVARGVHLRFIFLIFPLQGGEAVNFETLSVIFHLKNRSNSDMPDCSAWPCLIYLRFSFIIFWPSIKSKSAT